ncbi:hypothetical protein LGK97_08195 [Clostridium sp. CS001]|uniref:hypothetical protein n=1 Tax=Clostridium sp. CS001 TaxID=2880648 RepID=UPI001CF5B588|nr:hypothetical protein [Clostridium sp. CS001]MCB2289744.1 hypothetical protein [Clostridium sp. CS001]
MKYLNYSVLGFIVFFIVEFLSISVGGVLGSVPAEIGSVVSAISVLCAIIVICTVILVDAIKRYTQENK